MNEPSLIPEESIINKIYVIRGRKIMLDNDLAILYQVKTKVLNQSVKRNSLRFPKDFMFQLTENEWENLRSQIVTSSWGGRRILPYAFTEQGISMLSSVLKSEVAIKVYIHIIRVFTKMREVLLSHKDILLKMEEIEKKVAGQDQKISVVFDYLKKFINQQVKPRNKIGFKKDMNN